MANDEVYSPIQHAKCRESLICMINKKLSKNVAIALAIAVIGIPSVFIIYAMTANAKDKAKVVEIDKKVQVYSVKQDTIIFNQQLFRKDLESIQIEHKKETEKLHIKMEESKKDIIKEIRRLHN